MKRRAAGFLNSIWVGCAGWAALVAVTAGTAHANDVLTLLPPEVETLAYIPNVPAATAKLRGSPFQRFYADPRAAEFFKPLRENLESRSRELAGILGGDPEAASSFMTGGFAVATLGSGGKRGGGDYVIVYEHDGRSPDLAATQPRKRGSYVQRVPARFGEFKFERIVTTEEVYEEIRGGKKKSDRKGSGNAASELAKAKRQIVTEEAFFKGKDWVIWAGSTESMKAALERLASPNKLPSVHSAGRFASVAGGLGHAADLVFYADLENWAGGEIDASLFGGDVNIARLGLREIKGAALGLSFQADRFLAEFSIYAPEPRQGAGKLLFMNEPLRGSGDAANPFLRILPSDAIGYSTYGSDIGATWREFRRILREGAPQVGEIFDVYFRSLEQTASVDLERAIFEGLGKYWATFTRVPAVGGARPETTVALAVRDGVNFQKAARTWLGEMGALLNYEVKETAVGGFPCFHLVGADVSAGAFVGLEQLANVCVTDEWVLMSPRVEHIEAALAQRGQAVSAVTQSAEYERVMANLPEDRFFETFIASGGFGPSFSSPVVRVFTGLMGGAGGSLVELSSVPDQDLWRKYFGPAGGAARKSRHAISMSFFVLYNEMNAAASANP